MAMREKVHFYSKYDMSIPFNCKRSLLRLAF